MVSRSSLPTPPMAEVRVVCACACASGCAACLLAGEAATLLLPALMRACMNEWWIKRDSLQKHSDIV